MTDPSRKYLTSSREKQLSLKQSEENRTSGKYLVFMYKILIYYMIHCID